MFENLIGQDSVKKTIQADINSGKMPPSILLSGYENSGKLTTALELARVMSCEQDGLWKCKCNTCKLHRELNSSDLIIMGSRDCSLEINAAANTFIATPSLGTGYLFVRAVRKLTKRFDSRIRDTDENKFLKAAPFLAEVDTILNTFFYNVTSENFDLDILKKLIEKIIKNTQKIQDECMYDTIPVNHVRKASSWIRLKPSGKKKFLIIENADKMQESARNAFLKILEEPPEYAHFILTTTNRSAIMQTIISRVRPYTFVQRTAEEETDIISRVFRDPNNSTENTLTSYLYKFLPVELSVIKQAAFSFWNIILNDNNNKIFPASLLSAIEESNFLKTESKNTVTEIINSLNKCKPNTVFILLLENIMSFINIALHKNNTAMNVETYAKVYKLITEAKSSNNKYNISVKSVLEDLIVKIGEIL